MATKQKKFKTNVIPFGADYPFLNPNDQGGPMAGLIKTPHPLILPKERERLKTLFCSNTPKLYPQSYQDAERIRGLITYSKAMLCSNRELGVAAEIMSAFDRRVQESGFTHVLPGSIVQLPGATTHQDPQELITLNVVLHAGESGFDVRTHYTEVLNQHQTEGVNRLELKSFGTWLTRDAVFAIDVRVPHEVIPGTHLGISKPKNWLLLAQSMMGNSESNRALIQDMMNSEYEAY